MIKDAVEIVRRLKEAGFQAYFAGGWVRDYVLKHPSNDIDIATNANPDEVIALFKNTVPIGKAFGVVLVVMNEVGYEVASFRRDDLYIDGRRPALISFSTAEEDAARRDFTINGLFFDPVEEKVIDFVGGVEDINQGIVKAIGNANERFYEDRLRMLRAVRFSVKLGFKLDEATEKAVKDFAKDLYPSVSKERVLQELKKMGEHPSFHQALLEMKRLDLLDVIFPILKDKSYEEIHRILNPLADLSPRITFLLVLSSLFYDVAQESVMDVFEDLKLSSQEKLDLLYGLFCQTLIYRKGPITNEEWVKFFSHPLNRQGIFLLQAMSTSFTRDGLGIIAESLASHIDRKARGVTLLGSKELMEQGITPGKKMGELLKEGERAAINLDLKSKEEVLEFLKNSPYWKHD